MTMLADPPASELLSWSSPVVGLWVASTPSAYVGMVEELDTGFAANGSSSEDLGVHATLAGARVAVYNAWTGSETPGRQAARTA